MLTVVWNDIGPPIGERMEILHVVGTAVGAQAHIASLVGGFTLCGLSISGMLVGWRFLWPQQTSCAECLSEYAGVEIERDEGRNLN